MDAGTTGPIHFLNLEYFFRLLYESMFHGGDFEGTVSGGAMQIGPFLSSIWNLATVLGFVFSLLFLMFLVFATVRIYQIRHQEEHLYEDIEFEEADRQTDRSRWVHVASLVESTQERDWRQALIEADIMLDEVLTEQGYEGNTVADKLSKVDPARFKTLNDAWEAHNVRNQMAANPDEPVRDEIAYRAIKHYESVFREFNTIDA